MRQKLLFLVFLLLSPSVWLVSKNINAVLNEWHRLPSGIITNLKSKAQNSYLVRVQELRWGGRSLHRNSLFSRIIYNRQHLVFNEVFDAIQYLTPKLYFLAGDGEIFTPRRIEPVSSLLFPFWIIGILTFLKQKNKKIFLLLGFFTLLAFLSGRKNMAILFPVLILQVYIAAAGVDSFSKNKLFIPLLAILLTYGVYISSMNIWLST